MKKIIAVILFTLVTSFAYGQFELKTGIGMGLEVRPDFSTDIYQTTMSATQQYKIDKVIVYGLEKALMGDSSTTGFLGTGLGYLFPVEGTDKHVVVSAQYYFGTDNSNLWGGEIGYGTGLIEINLAGYYKQAKGLPSDGAGVYSLNLCYFILK